MAKGETYQEFVDKFKPKKTTDDCYTPDAIYNAIRDWACKEYNLDPGKIVRPFWPGGDYEHFDYPEGCIVLDNPPFSILSKIIDFYDQNNIDYFLFEPELTSISRRGAHHIVSDCKITYENGAIVPTGFATNLEPAIIRSAPDLYKALQEVDKRRRKETTKQIPKYQYPRNVLTVSMVKHFSKAGVVFKVYEKDTHFIRRLEDQKSKGKTIFGAGYLISDKCAAEKEAAEKEAAEKKAAEQDKKIYWQLSEEERNIIKGLG